MVLIQLPNRLLQADAAWTATASLSFEFGFRVVG